VIVSEPTAIATAAETGLKRAARCCSSRRFGVMISPPGNFFRYLVKLAAASRRIWSQAHRNKFFIPRRYFANWSAMSTAVGLAVVQILLVLYMGK
jgi:hypothetical protein